MSVAFLGDEVSRGTPEQARFEVLPVPLERSVSYGRGTARGPAAILNASQQVEFFNGCDVPARHGIFTHEPVPCEGRELEDVLNEVGRRAVHAVEAGRVPLVLGGEHTVSVGPLRALASAGRAVGVVQFDAHADLRDSYQDDPMSHACAMARVLDTGLPLFQIGVRSLSKEEQECRRSRAIPHLDAEYLEDVSPSTSPLPDAFPEELYITFDVDALDASLMPATGTPEPGGLSWRQAVSLLRGVVKGRTIIAADVAELAPVTGLHACDYTAAKLAYTIMGLAV